MGLWDFITSLFGGGAKMDLQLDASEVPVGGILSGKAILIGASKDYPVTSVKVQLVYVETTFEEDSSLPKIDFRVLMDNTIAQNETLSAGQTREFSFTFQVPTGTEPSASNVSYQVKVVADIPGIKDPNKIAELKVLEPDEDGSGAATMSLEGLYARWPALRGTAERPLVDALRDMRWSHSDYDAEKDLIIAEPLVARLMREGSAEVQAAALETWSAIIGDRARKENIKTLGDILKQPNVDEDVLYEALDAAGRFAAVGGVALLSDFAKHPTERIRERVASALTYSGGEGKDKRALLLTLTADESHRVRAQAVRGLGEYAEDRDTLKRLAALAQSETHPDVLVAVMSSSRSGFYYDHGDLLFNTLTTLSKHSYVDVRREVANSMGAAVGRVKGADQIALALMEDAESEVRSTAAYEVQNMNDEDRAVFKPLLKKLAESDPSGEVRTSAIDAFQSVFTKEETLAFYGALMQNEPTEAVLRGIVHGIKYEGDAEYKAILKTLSSCQFPRVADEARDGFEYDAS
jgi:HEAT repeat protein